MTLNVTKIFDLDNTFSSDKTVDDRYWQHVGNRDWSFSGIHPEYEKW